jgi:hypothetical protein
MIAAERRDGPIFPGNLETLCHEVQEQKSSVRGFGRAETELIGNAIQEYDQIASALKRD